MFLRVKEKRDTSQQHMKKVNLFFVKSEEFVVEVRVSETQLQVGENSN